MATQYQMQASYHGALVSWLSTVPDFSGAFAGGLSPLLDITLVGGGIDNTGSSSSVPDGAYVFDDGSYVVFDDGSYAISDDVYFVFDDGSIAALDDGSLLIAS